MIAEKSLRAFIVEPVQMTEEIISYLLEAKGMKPEDINYVSAIFICHPDHLGGASFFPHANFILTRKCMDVYKKPN